MHRKSKKLLAWSLVVCLILTQMLFSNFAFAGTKAGLTTDRFAGADRYQTAIEISKAEWTTSQYAVLAYGEGFADALAAGPLADKYNAPILLTGKDSLPAGVLDELKRLGTKTVFVVGGEGVVSKAVADALTVAGIAVERIAGADRYATALKVAEKVGTTDTVVVAYGENYPDALSISAIAAAKGWPILLTDKDAMSADVKAYIGSKKVYVVGGSGVVSDAVVNSFANVERLGGSDRYDTNLKVLEKFAADLNFLNIFLATGEGFADALAGSVLAARYASPVVLVYQSVTPATQSFLSSKITNESGVFAFGGTAVVSSAAIASVKPAAPTSFGVVSVTATNLNQFKVVFSKDVDETAAEDVRNYVYEGAKLVPGTDIAVMQSDNKTVIITMNTPQSLQYKKVAFRVEGNVFSKDLLEKNSKYETELTMSDIEVPTVTGVSVTGNKLIKLSFSEAVKLPATWNDFKIDGQSLYNWGFREAKLPDAGTVANRYNSSVEFYFDVALPAGAHTLKVPAGTDAMLVDGGNFKVAEKEVSFTVENNTTAPTVTNIDAKDNGILYVTFDRSMKTGDSTNILNAAYYAIDNVGKVFPTVAPTFKSNTGNTVVKLTFGSGVVVEGPNVLEISKDVKDPFGNKIGSDNVRIPFTASEDTVKPAVKSVTIMAKDQIRVVFTEDVKQAYAETTSNYTLKDSDGVEIALQSATLVAGKSDSVDLKPAKNLTGSNYSLKVKNIIDLARIPNVMDEYTTTVSGIDDVDPIFDHAVKVDGSSQKVAVYFSESMDSSTLTNKSNYYYIDNVGTKRVLPSGASVSMGDNAKHAIIEFPSSYTTDLGAAVGNEFKVAGIRVANVKDLAGNYLADVAAEKMIEAAAAVDANPTIIKDSFKLFSDSSKVWGEFSMNQLLSTLNISDFQIAGQTPDSGYVVGTKVVLNYTTSAKKAAVKAAGKDAMLVTVAMTSKNEVGVPVAVINEQVYDDQIKPAIVKDANDNVIVKAVDNGATGDQVKIKFSEPIDTSVVGLYNDDFAFTNATKGTALKVVSVSFDANNNYLVYTLKTSDANLDSFAAGDSVSARAVSGSVDIRDMKDRNDDRNVYEPTSDDLSGYYKVIAEAGVVTPVSVAAVADINVANGTALAAVGLPATLEVTMSDGSKVQKAVTWNGGTPAYAPATAGTYTFSGAVAGTTLTASAKVIVAAAPVAEKKANVTIAKGAMGFVTLTVNTVEGVTGGVKFKVTENTQVKNVGESVTFLGNGTSTTLTIYAADGTTALASATVSVATAGAVTVTLQ